MTFKIMINHLVIVSQQVELPELCPGHIETKNGPCGAMLTEEDAVRVVEYQDQSRFARLKNNEGHSDDIDWSEQMPEQGDDHVELAYLCAACDHELLSGKTIRREMSDEGWDRLQGYIEMDM